MADRSPPILRLTVEDGRVKFEGDVKTLVAILAAAATLLGWSQIAEVIRILGG